WLSGRSAQREDVPATRRWVWLGLLLGLAFAGLRLAELLSLDFRWDSNAHASAFWLLQGFHGVLALAELVENALFAAVLSWGPIGRAGRWCSPRSGRCCSRAVGQRWDGARARASIRPDRPGPTIRTAAGCSSRTPRSGSAGSSPSSTWPRSCSRGSRRGSRSE